MTNNRDPEINYNKEFKEIDYKEFKDAGYLLEVNRRFFHPLGLAMFVDDDETVVGIYDWREDPEGGAFASLNDEGDQEKHDNISGEWDKRAVVREGRFGWVIQPIGTTVEEDDNGFRVEYH